MTETALVSATALFQILKSRGLKIGFGESCTGGLAAGTFARLAGVSEVFMGGVVSYSYEAKVDLLNVSLESLQTLGAVSDEIARQMARGVCKRLHVDCSIAITGIAGPGGGTADKPVGTVWFAVKGPDFEQAEKQIFAGDRASVQNQSVEWALGFLLRKLQEPTA